MKLNPRFKILSSAPPANAEDEKLLLSWFPSVPEEFLSLMRIATRLELQVDLTYYIRIWGPSTCMDHDQGYGISSRIPGAVTVADNGGGTAVIYWTGKKGFGLYLTEYSVLDPEDFGWLAPSLSDFLQKGTGIPALKWYPRPGDPPKEFN